MSRRTLYTIGHSTRSAGELIDILHAFRVTRLVDIRSIPRSRTKGEPASLTPFAVIGTSASVKGYTVRASKQEPQYVIESDKTDHVAVHKGSALRKLRGAAAGRSL